MSRLAAWSVIRTVLMKKMFAVFKMVLGTLALSSGSYLLLPACSERQELQDCAGLRAVMPIGDVRPLSALALIFMRGGESGDGVPLTKCLAPSNVVPVIPRLLPLPTACKDKDPTICNAIFAVRSVAVDNAVAGNAFLVNPNCQNATVLTAAEALRPSSCAICCLTPEFSRRNCMFLIVQTYLMRRRFLQEIK
ncbi:unnamed protein product [Dracunculus medinensis]|uniref:Secreted protein n=1 Tax=Dracunculus medinensis TaxID=318479 RepID=A0A0N4U822_DRAME|nr:unnamed protein product [Dracunculus medinensis]